ncbi:MAG: DNA primase [Rhodospirillales bacterium]|nr:DNA primase [Rhodospirillales bacterium]
MSLPTEFLDQLRARVGLAEVIGARVRLVRRGRQFLGLCPFHGEKTPSFHVYEDHFHCFGCGAHGSLFDFVMLSESVGFRDAVERIAALAGMTVPEASPEARERERRRGSLFDAIEAASAYFHKMLRMPEGRPAAEYLRRRAVSEAAIERFRLGFAPDGRSALKSALARDGFTDEAMIEAGLLVAPEDAGRSSYDRFRARVMFPIADSRGRVVGFGGRLLESGEPKYLNSPETPLFHKGRMLYGLAHAAPAAAAAGTIIVVEGYMDVIGLAEAGWNNVVAPLGTALTDEQLQTLWRLAPEPVLLFDADAAGERAALRAAERALPLLHPGFGLRFANLMAAPGDDPDAAARRYPKQLLHRAIVEAAPLSEFLLMTATRQRRLNNAEDFAALEQRLNQYALEISDADARRQFQQTFRSRVRRAAFRGTGNIHAGAGTAMRAARRKGRGAEPPWAARASIGAPPAVAGANHADGAAARPAEWTLLAIMLNHPEFFHEVEDSFGAIAFTDFNLDQLRQAIVQALSGGETLDATRLADALAAAGQEECVADVLADPLIRTHRQIAPSAPLEQVRATWEENLAVVRNAALSPLSTATAGGLARLTRQRAAGSGGDDD